MRLIVKHLNTGLSKVAKHQNTMKEKSIFLFVVALSSVMIVAMIVYMKETVHYITRVIDEIDIDASAAIYDYNSELHDYKEQHSTGFPTRKSFIYLTETEQCLSKNLATCRSQDLQL